MEIKASCRIDFNECKATAYYTLYGKYKPLKKILIRAAFSTALLIFGMSLVIIRDYDRFVCGAAALYSLLVVFGLIRYIRLYFTFPNKQYEAKGNMKDILNEFVFYDDRMLNYSASDGYRDEVEISYGMLFAVNESSEYLFLLPTKNSMFVVDKSTISGGTMEELRDKLKSVLGDKYIICEY